MIGLTHLFDIAVFALSAFNVLLIATLFLAF
jgi:hypothetical protein